MKILGMDTSSPSGSIALLDDNDIVCESVVEGSPAYSDKLLFEINAILNSSRTKLNDIDCFVITTGPGSFTGLRVGIRNSDGTNKNSKDHAAIRHEFTDGLYHEDR